MHLISSTQQLFDLLIPMEGPYMLSILEGLHQWFISLWSAFRTTVSLDGSKEPSLIHSPFYKPVSLAVTASPQPVSQSPSWL